MENSPVRQIKVHSKSAWNNSKKATARILTLGGDALDILETSSESQQ